MARYLLFALGPYRLGVALDDVVELLPAMAVQPLPGAPGITRGVLRRKGRLLPVLSAHERFGLPRAALAPSAHFVVLAVASRQVILHVDRALEITTIAQAPQPTEGLGWSQVQQVAGLVDRPDGLLLLHDPHSFLTEAEQQALDEALDGGQEASPP